MEGSQATVLLTIMINAAHAVVKDTLITPGERLPEVVTPARAERFITSANLVRQLRQDLTLQLLHTIRRHDVRQSILLHGQRTVVPEEHTRGTVIIIFCVLCAEISVTQVQNGVQYTVIRV